MSDYFSEYSHFVGQKTLPSPIDTPYETPAYIRSMRSSRVGSIRDQSLTPPPLPPDNADMSERARDGRYSALDPRRFTPTLHASLVSEILSLKREVAAKNGLVESLESIVASGKLENEALNQRLATNAKEMRKAKQQLEHMEKGTYEAVADLVAERDQAKSTVEELKSKLEKTQKQTRRQGDDAVKTQELWERDKEAWQGERRQLERRIHVTESRLRAFVDEMSSRQHDQHVHIEEPEDAFKDSGVGEESDSPGGFFPSPSPPKPRVHSRNTSRMSTRSVQSVASLKGRPDSMTVNRWTAGTPDHISAKTNGFTLADELDIDEDDEEEADDLSHADDELDDHERARRTMESRQSAVLGDLDHKAKRVLGLAVDVPSSPLKAEPGKGFDERAPETPQKTSMDLLHESSSVRRNGAAAHGYVDRGCQPSPPLTPPMSDDNREQHPTTFADGEYSEAYELAAQQSPVKNPQGPALAINCSELSAQAESSDSPTLAKIERQELPTFAITEPDAVGDDERSPLPIADIDSDEEIGLEKLETNASPKLMLDAQTQTLPLITEDALDKILASPPSPPDTPAANDRMHQDGAGPGILPAPELPPRPVYANSSTQTELVESLEKDRPKSYASTRDSLSPPEGVPWIAISPPTPRPSSPRKYVLPPGTKNASTQVALPWPSRDASIQTEEIRVDKRPVKLPPHLLPSYLLPSPSFDEGPTEKVRKRVSGGGTTTIFTRTITAAQKRPRSPIVSPLVSPLVSPTESSPPDLFRPGSSQDTRSRPLRAIPLPRPVLAPLNAGEGTQTDGPLSRSVQYGVSRGVPGSSRHLAHLSRDGNASDDEDEIMADAEPKDVTGSVPSLSRAPQGRFGLSEPPKVVPEDKEISPERRPATSGSAAGPAPSIASSSRNNAISRKPPVKLNSYRNLHTRSPSFGSMASSFTSTASVPPPFPIPARSSSRIISSTRSDGSASPSPFPSDPFAPGPSNAARKTRQLPREKPNLRKVQSATAIRAQAVRGSPRKNRRHKRLSPELTPVQSLAFESPGPAKFPVPELPTPLANGPGSDWGGGSGRAHHTARSSVGTGSTHEPTLVDAIAATMVGEWMLKYIRKRKSFGVGETSPDYLKNSGDERMVDITGNGVRHKRWVWLSPYERTIMWDTKQPSSGAALLGKRGRKLPIESVLDVQDNTPLPRGTEAKAFNRSILILTPQRALKFTAPSQDRHDLWMSALTFLATGSPMNEPEAPPPPMPILPPVPSMPVGESSPLKRPRALSFGRANIRDSVRIAKGSDKQRAVRTPSRTADGLPSGNNGTALPDYGADFPAVPRLYSSTTRHLRKRSNTSPRLPPHVFGGGSNANNISSTALSGLATNAKAKRSGSSWGEDTNLSRQGSSTQSPIVQMNFFEAVQGTVRMEAFVDPSVKDGVLYVPPLMPVVSTTSEKTNNSVGTSGSGGVSAVVAQKPPPRRRHIEPARRTSTQDKRRGGYVFDDYGLDPFRGF